MGATDGMLVASAAATLRVGLDVVGRRVGLADVGRTVDGRRDGLCDVGVRVVGERVGLAEVGERVGLAEVGELEGEEDGEDDGVDVGAVLGADDVGAREGDCEGVRDGARDGDVVGLLDVGPIDGELVVGLRDMVGDKVACSPTRNDHIVHPYEWNAWKCARSRSARDHMPRRTSNAAAELSVTPLNSEKAKPLVVESRHTLLQK